MKKTISIFLSLLMLGSSSGIAYAQHFCSGMEMLAEITIVENQLSCEMDIQKSDCCDENTDSSDNDCCKNHITKIQTDDNFAKTSFDLKLNTAFAATFVAVFVLPEFTTAFPDKNFFADYIPPLIEKDFNILFDTFLI